MAASSGEYFASLFSSKLMVARSKSWARRAQRTLRSARHPLSRQNRSERMSGGGADQIKPSIARVSCTVHPDRAVNQQDEQDLLWIREPFLSSGKDFGRLIVHGHTPLASGIPDVHSNRVNLDTAAVYGGPLTAALLSDRSPGPELFFFAR